MLFVNCLYHKICETTRLPKLNRKFKRVTSSAVKVSDTARADARVSELKRWQLIVTTMPIGIH